MKTSELIKHLESFNKRFGDHEVTCHIDRVIVAIAYDETEPNDPFLLIEADR